MITTQRDKTLSPTLPSIELPALTETHNIELRLLPYWSGVKHFRTANLNQQFSPHDYYKYIVQHNQNPTVVGGKVVGFNSRADMYFSRLPFYVQQKMWLNFGTMPTALQRNSVGF